MITGESRLTFALAALIVAIIVTVFLNRYGLDAAPYACGLGIAALIAMYFVIKGVEPSED